MLPDGDNDLSRSDLTDRYGDTVRGIFGGDPDSGENIPLIGRIDGDIGGDEARDEGIEEGGELLPIKAVSIIVSN